MRVLTFEYGESKLALPLEAVERVLAPEGEPAPLSLLLGIPEAKASFHIRLRGGMLLPASGLGDIAEGEPAPAPPGAPPPVVGKVGEAWLLDPDRLEMVAQLRWMAQRLKELARLLGAPELERAAREIGGYLGSGED